MLKALTIGRVFNAVIFCSSIIEARLDGEARKNNTLCEMVKEWIKQCCASCEYREIEENGSRLCIKMQVYVKQKFVCSQWELSKGFKCCQQ